MFIRETFAVGSLGCNCTILGDAASGEGIVIDPGDEVPRILARAAALGVRHVRALVHTHAHIDHIGGAADLHAACGAPVYLHPDDTFLHGLLPLQARMLGLPVPHAGPIDRPLADGDAIGFGAHELGVMHTPGHTPGSVCFVVPGEAVCFAGDTLFAGSVGRTDLPGGDPQQIVRSIRDRLYTLPDETAVVAGHGQPTTVARERRHNPFVRGA